MREINNTIYDILKMDEPEEGINVTQIITDDLVRQSDSGEAKAVRGATEILNKKADDIHKTKEEKTKPKIIRASGSKTKTTKLPEEIKQAGQAPAPPATPGQAASPSRTPVKKPVPLSAKKVAKKASTTAGTTSKKVVRKAVSDSTKTKKKVVKKTAAQAPQKTKKKSNPLVLLVLLAIIVAIAGFVYLEMA